MKKPASFSLKDLFLLLGLFCVTLGGVAAPAQGAAPVRRSLLRPPVDVARSVPGSTAFASGGLTRAFTISADAPSEIQSAAAYNSKQKEYLVVWSNDRAGCDDIYGRRVSRDGALKAFFSISAGCPVDRWSPDVAYNSQHDQYLVVWEQYDPGAGYSIQARRVSNSGQVLDAADIPIRGAGANLYTPVQPAVDYAYTSDRYLVVWAETWHPMPITYEISGQGVAETGALVGSSFLISQNTVPLQAPDLAYNRHANRYLVVWQQEAGSLWDIHGQQVFGDGGLFQGDITIAYYTKASTHPSVAALPNSPTSDTFLVAWEILYVPPSDHDIYGRLVGEDGTPGTDFWISWANGQDETSPAVAGDELTRRYLVTWRHPLGIVDIPIRGRVIAPDGNLVGVERTLAAPAADRPAVAAGAGDFLVAFDDQSVFATNRDLWGQLWDVRLYLPLVMED